RQYFQPPVAPNERWSTASSAWLKIGSQWVFGRLQSALLVHLLVVKTGIITFRTFVYLTLKVMKRLFVLCITAFMLTAIQASAQEICNNGKDDDNDGFIDCYDNDCAVSTFCKGFYLGDDAMCEATPPAFPKF